jgi:hypothetical protein
VSVARLLHAVCQTSRLLSFYADLSAWCVW